MGIQALDACVAFAVSLLSGYLGIGGGILMAPALLYLPPVLGLPAPSMHEVTGATMAQAFLACSTGAWMHGRRGCLDRRLVGWVGAGLLPGSLAGALLSSAVPPWLLQGMLAALSLVAAGLMARAMPDGDVPAAGSTIAAGPLGVALGGGVGLVCGMLGQGGSFVLIPSMIALLRVPTRIAVGSNLALVLLSSIAGLAGKAATGQVTMSLALAIGLGAVPGATIGSRFSHRTAPRHLRLALCVLVGAAGVALAIGAVRASGPCPGP